MPNEKIQLTDDQVDQFYERLGSKHFTLQSDVAREYAKNIIDIYFRSVGFAATVISTIGIIAGFGFTAFSFIESKIFFFAGEGILLYSIIHGLVWVRDIYNGEYQTLTESRRKQNAHFKERNDQFRKVWDELQKSNELDEAELSKLNILDNKTPQFFSSPKEVREKPHEIFSKKLYYFMITGVTLLFASFFICRLLGLFGIHSC